MAIHFKQDRIDIQAILDSGVKIMFFKAYIPEHQRRLKSGKAVTIRAHDDKRPPKQEAQIARSKTSQALMSATDAKLAAMEENKLKQIIGTDVYDQAKQELAARNIASPLTEPEQVALYAWTLDTGNDALFRRINHALRIGEAFDGLGPMIALMQSALDKLPNYAGTVYRAVKRGGFDGKLPSFDKAHFPNKTVRYTGFTGASKLKENTLRGNIKLHIISINGKNISNFSKKPGQEEILFPIDSVFFIYRRTNSGKGVDLWLRELSLKEKSEAIMKSVSKW